MLVTVTEVSYKYSSQLTVTEDMQSKIPHAALYDLAH